MKRSAGLTTAATFAIAVALLLATLVRPEAAAARGICLDSAGNVFFTQTSNSAVRKVNIATNIITTVAGNGTSGYSGDNGQATAEKLNNPVACAFDASGNLLVADQSNNRVRKIDMTTGVITTFAGNGGTGVSGDNGAPTSATLETPWGIVVGSDGAVYIAQNLQKTIRKVHNNVITTVATYASYSATFMARYDDNNLLVSTASSGHRVLLQPVSGATASVFIGDGTNANTGDNGAATSAQIAGPQGLARDPDGNTFIASNFGRMVRVVSSSGTVTTLAGNGTSGYGGDGQPASNTITTFGNLWGLAYDSTSEAPLHRGRKLEDSDDPVLVVMTWGGVRGCHSV